MMRLDQVCGMGEKGKGFRSRRGKNRSGSFGRDALGAVGKVVAASWGCVARAARKRTIWQRKWRATGGWAEDWRVLERRGAAGLL